MGLQQFERRLERLVEGVFARAFRSGLQPVEIGRRLTREMDLRRTVAPRGTLTPNAFTVVLSASDRERFAPIEGELIEELISVARDHARTEGYVFLGKVSVELTTDESLTKGVLLVSGEMTQAGGGAASLILSDGRRIPLGAKTVKLGRLPDCDVVLTDANVSRHHAEIRKSEDGGGGYIVVDMGSTNGTKVNGVGVRSQRLQHGDELGVGGARMRYEAQ